MEPGLIFLYSVIRRDLSEKVKFGNLIRNLTDEEKAFQFKGRASTQPLKRSLHGRWNSRSLQLEQKRGGRQLQEVRSQEQLWRETVVYNFYRALWARYKLWKVLSRGVTRCVLNFKIITLASGWEIRLQEGTVRSKEVNSQEKDACGLTRSPWQRWREVVRF